MSELRKQFKPEFLNRIDEIIVFHKLTDEDISKIIDIMLKEVKERLSEKKIELSIDKSAKELIAKKGTDSSYGARPLRRAIQSILEDQLAEEILDGKLKDGYKARAIDKDDNIEIEIK